MLPLMAALAAGVALLLASAKAHGRQLRLERELEGHRTVVFGGANHPFVEVLWRRDRVRFWSLVPLVAAAQAGLLVLARAGPAGWLTLLVAPFVAGFAALGLLSLARLRRAMRTRRADPPWRREALRGSALWWGLVAALALATAVLWARA